MPTNFTASNRNLQPSVLIVSHHKSIILVVIIQSIIRHSGSYNYTRYGKHMAIATTDFNGRYPSNSTTEDNIYLSIPYRSYLKHRIEHMAVV
jgi:hypothetical protein